MHTVRIIVGVLGMALLACAGSEEKPPQESENSEKINFTKEKAEGDSTLALAGTNWLLVNLNLAVPDSWCYADQAACEPNGRLYRWAAAQVACKALGQGWRLPTDAEWQAMAQANGGFQDWTSIKPTGNAILGNTQLQSAESLGLPLAGWRGSGGGFDSQGEAGFYWSADAKDEVDAWCFQLGPSGAKLTRRQANKQIGMSCRCVR